jgi:hypothetical protein
MRMGMSMMAWFDVVLAELARIAAECEALEAMRDVNTVEVRRAAARIRAHASNVFREVSESGHGVEPGPVPGFARLKLRSGTHRTRYSGAYQEADK